MCIRDSLGRGPVQRPYPSGGRILHQIVGQFTMTGGRTLAYGLIGFTNLVGMESGV